MEETSGKVSTTAPFRRVHVCVSQPYGLAEDALNIPVTVRALVGFRMVSLARWPFRRRRPG